MKPEVLCAPKEPKEIVNGELGGITADSGGETLKIEREMERIQKEI